MSRTRALQPSASSVEQSLGSEHGLQQSPYMTAVEAAAYLRYANVRVLYKQIVAENIPCRRRGGKTFLFVKAELDRWLEGERPKRGAMKLVARG